MRSQRPPLYWVAVFFLLAGALTAGDPWTWPLWLHRPWAHVVEALAIIIGGISTQVFRVWPPACFAIEALTLTQDFPSPIPNLSDQKSRRRSVGSMGERLILVWAAIVMGTSSVLHAWGVRHDPPFPLADDSLLAEIPWPDRETIPVIRPPGRAAYWDPWYQRMVVGCQWDQSTWTRRHIVAHELAHAQQSPWRLRLSDGWLCLVTAGVFLLRRPGR